MDGHRSLGRCRFRRRFRLLAGDIFAWFWPQLGWAQGICGWNACFCSLINSRMSWWNVRETTFRPHEFAPVFDVKGACPAGFQMRVQGLRFEGADGAPGSSVPSRLLMASAAPGPAGLPFSLMFPSPLSSPGSRAGSSCQVSGRPLQWMPPGGVARAMAWSRSCTLWLMLRRGSWRIPRRRCSSGRGRLCRAGSRRRFG